MLYAYTRGKLSFCSQINQSIGLCFYSIFHTNKVQYKVLHIIWVLSFYVSDDEVPDDNRSGTRTAAGGRQQRAGRTTCPGAGERVSSWTSCGRVCVWSERNSLMESRGPSSQYGACHVGAAGGGSRPSVSWVKLCGSSKCRKLLVIQHSELVGKREVLDW